ncbi:MAG: purine-binding chemotaxis protein CheW [Pseudomonadales bacterium]|nr:purine-binding chemotaxis protein CheW [Pseudomonadales bacterium]
MTKQYLTFFLDGEEYGVDILGVQEIRGWEKTTVLPNSPRHIKGVINLRGTIVPITDLRERFCLESKEYGPVTVVIVLNICDESANKKVVGIVVDAVSDVYDIPSSGIKSSPEVEQQVANDFVDGLYNIDEKMLILLDIDRLLKTEAQYSELAQ